MRNLSILLLSVSLISSVLGLNTTNHHFCEAYKRSDQKVLIFSYRESGSLFIIGDKLWNVTTNGSDMEFESLKKPKDFVANSPQYSYVIPGEFEGKKDRFHFYNPKTSYFDLLKRDNVSNQFKLISFESEFSCNPKLFPMTFIISDGGKDGYDFGLIGTIEHWFDDGLKRIQRRIQFVLIFRYDNCDNCLGKDLDVNKWDHAVKSIGFADNFRNIAFIHYGLEVIGVTVPALSSGSVVFVFFRNGSQILYCNMEECLNDKIRLLIDCSPYLTTESPPIPIESELCDNTYPYVTVIPLIIIILVLVLIILWAACTKRLVISKDKQSLDFESKQNSNVSIRTVDSKTGLPINKPEEAVHSEIQSFSDKSNVENETKQLSAQQSEGVKQSKQSNGF